MTLAGWWSSIPDATNSGSKWNTTFLSQHWMGEAIIKSTKNSRLEQQPWDLCCWANLWFLNTFCPQVAQCFLQIVPCQQMSSPLTLPLSTPKCCEFYRYPTNKTRVVFLAEGNPLCIPLFLPHSSGWIGIDSCSKLIPQGKDFSDTRTLNNTHITRVNFLHSVGDIGPYGLVINRSCRKTFGYKTLPSLSVFLRAMFLCQPIPL